jgi:O-antigen ligase
MLSVRLDRLSEDSEGHSSARRRIADGAVMLYVAQVILFNPVLFDLGTVKVYTNTVVLVALACLQLLSRPDAIARRMLLQVLTATLLICAVVCATSIPAGLGPNALANAGRLAFLPIAAVAIVPSWRRYPAMLQMVVVALTIQCVVLLVQFSSFVNIVNRISPNGLGAANAFAMLVGIIVLLRLQLWTRARTASLWLTPILVTAMLYTYSRGAFVSLLVGFLVWLASSTTLRVRSRVAFSVVAAASLWVGLGSTIGERFTNLSLASASGRSDIFQRAIDGFALSPVWGNGFGSFTNAFAAGVESAHNVYLQIAYESGVVGLVGVAVGCVMALRGFVTASAAPVAAAVAVDAVVDNHFFVVQYTWALALYLAYCLWDRCASAATPN